MMNLSVQEEACHRAIAAKALDQAMAVVSKGGKPFMGRKQVTLVAEQRPRTQEQLMSMSMHGLSHNTRSAYGPIILQALKQVRRSSHAHHCSGFKNNYMIVTSELMLHGDVSSNTDVCRNGSNR